MYLVIIGWLYVAVMMSVAEANAPNGTLLGALVTFLLYGLLPTALVAYVMATPLRRKARLAREAAERMPPSFQPDACGQSASGTEAAGIAPVRKPD
jgi:hypothetical protein